MAQTSYDDAPAVAYPGMKADTGRDDHRASRVIEETDGIRPGTFVRKGTNNSQIKLPTLAAHITGDLAQGFVQREDMVETTTTGARPNKAVVPVMTKGRIWVICENGCVYGDPVFIRFSASGAERLGAARTDADTADAAQLPGARWVSNAAAGELATVEFSLP